MVLPHVPEARIDRYTALGHSSVFWPLATITVNQDTFFLSVIQMQLRILKHTLRDQYQSLRFGIYDGVYLSSLS